jgi:hypothetical protein
MKNNCIKMICFLCALFSSKLTAAQITNTRKPANTPTIITTPVSKNDTVPDNRRTTQTIRQLPSLNQPVKLAGTLPSNKDIFNAEKKKLFFQLEEGIYGQEFAYKNIFRTAAKYGTEKWTYKIAWWNNNPAIQYGRVEISTIPYPPFETKDFSGIVQSYIIKAPQKDSVVYDISYNSVVENKTAPLALIKLPNGVNIKPVKVQTNKPVIINQNNNGISEKMINQISKLNLTDIKAQPNRRASVNAFANNYTILLNSNNLTTTEGGTTFYLKNQLLTTLANLNTNDITYYIRIVPLGGRQFPFEEPTNTIMAKWDETLWSYSHPKPPCTPVSHESDYVITNIGYTPAHFPERNCTYSNDAENIDCKSCVVVATIKDVQVNEQYKKFGIGVNIGDIQCPAKKKESWYEKVIGSAASFATNTVNGASNLYNDAKNYAKDKFKEFNCNASGAMKIVNPVTLVQEAAGPEVCNALSGAAFDIGMAAMGIPPSIPNMDDLTNMGVDYALKLAIEQAGVDCDGLCQDLIKKGITEAVKQSAQKNFVDAGYYTVKPDPRGFYRNAYITITVKKTSNNTYKNKYPCGENPLDLLIDNSSKFNLTPNENISGFFVAGTTTNQSVFNGSLFNYAKMPLPFNAQTPIGTEVKIVRVLQPQLVYIKTENGNKSKIESILNSYEFTKENKMEADHLFLYNYEYRPQHYNVWRAAYKNAPIQFKFNFGKIKIADGVNDTFKNPAFVSDVTWDDTLD